MRIALLLLLGGCAYPQAMRRGAELEAQGDLRAALAQYDRAISARPRAEGAQLARAQVLQGAISEALRDARAALQRSGYEEVLEHVAYVQELEPSHEEAASLRVTVGERLVDDTRSAIARRDWVAAYDLAARTRDLVPERPEIPELLAAPRAWFLDASEQKTAEGDYREALEHLNQVSSREPDRSAEVEPREREVRGLWASLLAGQSEQREQRGLLGPALALRARAWEIAGRPEDADALRRMQALLRQQGQLPVSLRWRGDRTRHEHLRLALDHTGPLIWAEGGLVASIETPEARCSEGYTSSMAEQSYLAGQREVPNPQWTELERLLAETNQQGRELAELEAQMGVRLQQAQQRVQLAEAQLVPLRERHEKAQGHQQEAAAQIEAAQQRVSQLEAELERLRAQGADPRALAAMEMTLSTSREYLQEQLDRLARAEQTLADLRPAWEQAKADLDMAHGDALDVRAQLDGVLGNKFQTEQHRNDLRNAMQVTPRTLWEDVVELFRYEVQRWTRSCSGEARVSLAGAGLVPTTARLADAQQTWDDTHASWPAYGVQEDPLLYPVSDAELVRLMDERLATGVAQSVQRGVDAAYAVRLAQARELFASRPEEGAGLLFAQLLAAPTSVDADTRRWLEDWLARDLELETPLQEWLAGQ